MTVKTFLKKTVKGILPYAMVVWNKRRMERSDAEMFEAFEEIKPIDRDADTIDDIPCQLTDIRIKPKRKSLRFEVHLCDHCNLNCKHCGHLCPIAEKKFVDLNIFERDFKRISELTDRKCETVDLMGGEPLLHPQVTKILDISRMYFDTQIRLVTNGILLANQTDEFWRTCKKNNIIISISVYPIKLDWKNILSQAEKFGVELVSRKKFNNNEWFKLSSDLTGSQNVETAYSRCRFGNVDIFLEDGKLGVCDRPFLMRHFNKYYDKSYYKFPEPTEDDYVDIFKVNSLDEILERFTRPISYCRFCRPDSAQFVKWELSKKEIGEWI